MALTLLQLSEKRSDPNTRICVRVACWKYAKTLIAKPTPSPAELKQALKLLTDAALETYIIAVCVLIDDGTIDDAAIETAVATIANKFVDLEVQNYG